MPEVKNAVGFAQEAGADDGIGSTVDERGEGLVVIGGVVFKVGVLDDEDIAVEFEGGLEPPAEGGAFSAVGIGEEGGGVVSACELCEDVDGAVGGAVVDEEDVAGEGLAVGV